MTISVQCDCGKRLKAPDSLRGKKARCPGCGKALRVEEVLELDPLPEPVVLVPINPPAEVSSEELKLDDADLSLALPEEEPEDESDRGESADRLCPSCSAPMKPGAVLCTACGFSPRASGFAGAKRSQDTTRVYGTIMGIEMTLSRLIQFGSVALLLFLVIGWYYMFGPGRNFRVLEAEVVAGSEALPTISVLNPGSLGQLGGNVNLGMKGITKTAGGGTVGDTDIYGLGGGDKLFITRPDPAGGYLLIRAEINQSFLQNTGHSSKYDVVFNGGAYTLDTPAGPVPATLMAAELPSGTSLNTSEGVTCDYKALYPGFVKPTHEDVKLYTTAAASGHVTFNGGGATGKFDFIAPKISNPLGSSLEADGQLDVKSPQGMSISYKYGGGSVAVNWSPGVTGWRGCGQFVEKEYFWVYHKFTLVLLFPKPVNEGWYPLMLDKKKIASVWVPASAGPGGSSFVVVGPTTDTGTATSGSPASTSGSKSPGTGLLSGSDPLSQYFSALIRARQKAQSVVSASNIQQLTTAVLLYAEQHQGKLPDKLSDLRDTIDGLDQIMKNPRTGDIPGFIYVKPAETWGQIKDPAFTPMIYESNGGKQDPKGDIGYADGHVVMGM